MSEIPNDDDPFLNPFGEGENASQEELCELVFLAFGLLEDAPAETTREQVYTTADDTKYIAICAGYATDGDQVSKFGRISFLDSSEGTQEYGSVEFNPHVGKVEATDDERDLIQNRVVAAKIIDLVREKYPLTEKELTVLEAIQSSILGIQRIEPRDEKIAPPDMMDMCDLVHEAIEEYDDLPSVRQGETVGVLADGRALKIMSSSYDFRIQPDDFDPTEFVQLQIEVTYPNGTLDCLQLYHDGTIIGDTSRPMRDGESAFDEAIEEEANAILRKAGLLFPRRDLVQRLQDALEEHARNEFNTYSGDSNPN